jgi:hypothetical protein
MSAQEKAARLAGYVSQLRSEGFEYASAIDGEYHHMGATLTDAILQSGLNYKSTVRPRVDAIRAHSEASTTSGFCELLLRVGAGQLLAPWTGDEKPNRLVGLATFLRAAHVETEEDLRQWLDSPANAACLLELRGIGPKTLHYLGILAGRDDVAVDVHIMRFLREAGVVLANVEEAREIVCATADILGVRRSILDHSIWLFASGRGGG